jgi:hypothetical protein
MKRVTSKNVGTVSQWKKKKGKFVNARRVNWNEREGEQENGMDRQERMEKKNKIETLDTATCKNN